MPLKGNLRDFTTSQLLHLINLAHKTGSVVIEAPGHSAQLSFREGKLVYALLSGEDTTLPGILRKYGRLTEPQAQLIKQKTTGRSDKEIGLLLINAGYASQTDIVNCLRSHLVESVYRVFAWTEGLFRFEPALMPGADKIAVPIDLESVILEGVRRMKENERLSEELPNLDLALRFIERPNRDVRSMQLKPEEWRVVSYISPKNTMRAIARANKLSDLDMRKIVYGLIQAGLVEVMRPAASTTAGARVVTRPLTAPVKPSLSGALAGNSPVAPGNGASAKPPLPPAKPEDPKAKTGIINKLIARIRSL
jgi:hypothetical protein